VIVRDNKEMRSDKNNFVSSGGGGNKNMETDSELLYTHEAIGEGGFGCVHRPALRWQIILAGTRHRGKASCQLGLQNLL
jgi:hypothetical protein